MKRSDVEGLVVIFISLTILLFVFFPVLFKSTDSKEYTLNAPKKTFDLDLNIRNRFHTVTHDNHLWIIYLGNGDYFTHHPDCSCYNRKAEAE